MMCNDNQDKKLYGCFRGTVLKHLSNGECKIWIPSVYPDELSSIENANKLPSAQQATSLAFGANNGNGVFSYPSISAVVWCFFERGDQNFPVYFASTLGGKEAIKEWDVAFAMRGSPPDDAYMHHVQVKNTHVYMNESGTLEIQTHDNAKKNNCKLTMDSNGNITLQSTGTISLSASNILLNGTNQISIATKYMDQYASVKSCIKSPAVELDSSDGHTTIKSSAPYSPQNPAVETF